MTFVTANLLGFYFQRKFVRLLYEPAQFLGDGLSIRRPIEQLV
jgi:hypothetical protein